MSYTQTFSTTQCASSYYSGQSVYNAFRQGVPAIDTTSLSSYHAYRSLAWFDASAIASLLDHKIATKIVVNITSLNNSAESAGSCPVRLYRTNLKYDASKAGWNDANLANPAQNMTFANPTNDHYLQYWETDPLTKGSNVSSVLCTGSDADTLARALASGYGLGAWVLPEGKQRYQTQGAYNLRYMTITVEITAENQEYCSEPETVTVITTQAKKGESVNLLVEGAQDGANNPIDGYYIKKRWKLQSENWSAWSEPEFCAGTSERATITTTVTFPGSSWQFEVAAHNAVNTTDYTISLNLCDVYNRKRNIISVFDAGANDYTGNGSATLVPSKCEVSETAGGDYSLSMTHPIDDAGKWRFLQVGNVIKVNVPATPTKTVDVGQQAKIYQVNGNSNISVYSIASAPQDVSYSAWSYLSLFNASVQASATNAKQNPSIGDECKVNAVIPDYKCTYNGKNYQLKTSVFTWFNLKYEESGWTAYSAGTKYGYALAPTASNPYYAEIATQTGGGKLLATLSPGQNVYLVSDYNASWLKVLTLTGVEGYALKQNLKYIGTAGTSAVKDSSVSEQLFRIYNTVIDDTKRTVTVKSLHVSYDHAGNITQTCNIKNQQPATAVALLQASLVNTFASNVATDLTEDDGLYTGDLSWTNLSNCILNADKGLVAYYDAKLVRNNWDYYIYKKTNDNRGVTLKYGVNIKGVTWTKDSSKVVTRVIPYAKKSDNSELLLDALYVDSKLITAYPVIYCERKLVDGQVGKDDGKGGTWTTDTLKAEMQSKANERFDVDHADEPTVELKVDFILLGDTEEYKQYKGLQKLYLYDYVTVEDSTLGLSYTVEVTKTTFDVLNQRYTSITLGSVNQAATHLIGSTNMMNGSIDFTKLSASAVDQLLALAKNN